MSFLDVLRGMQNGPRGARDNAAAAGGMSPITVAVLGLLAYKAMKSFGGSRPGQGTGPAAGAPGMTPGSAMPGGLGGY